MSPVAENTTPHESTVDMLAKKAQAALSMVGHGLQQAGTQLAGAADASSAASTSTGPKRNSKQVMAMEHQYSAHNYHPLPVVFDHAKGAKVWDPEGVEYIDMLSAYSAVNQGHCHPRIVKALCDQAQLLTLSSRAFYSSHLGPFAKKVTEMFGYDMVLPMNTGVEAVETAVKLARRWGYVKKGIPENKAIVLAADGCFHGRTGVAISLSTDPDSRDGFGP